MTRPPDEDLFRDDPDFAAVTCPDCGADHPRVVSLFGGAASEVLFQCGRCRACFNWVKWNGRLPPTARPGGR
ncbi:PaaD-like zinc ribbon domain-containing protein [Azospirillum sp. ST 5-10]|uniref:PaaD-like zinc ribbon domain-containing protein n=1 Tax=unclassified Azospirillum TaxID=2630922 RepID=UPI003F49EBE2